MYLFIRCLRHAKCQAPCQVRGSGNTKTKESQSSRSGPGRGGSTETCTVAPPVQAWRVLGEGLG